MTGAFGEIRNSNFTENSAKSAAAVGLYNDANVLVISSTFLKNKAAEQGGAFVISGATTTINVSVYNAIYNEFFTFHLKFLGFFAENNSKIECKLSNIFLPRNFTEISQQTSFQENSAANGGVAVISGTKGQTFFGQCNFTKNSATQKGSDLYMDYNTNIQMVSTSLNSPAKIKN